MADQYHVLLYARIREDAKLADRICPTCGTPVWQHPFGQDCTVGFDTIAFPVNALLRGKEGYRG